METKANTLPTSEHFELKQLAEGVYAAIGKVGSPTFSNAGIIDLGDQTLVFDAFELPSAAKDLLAAAKSLTGRPATCVIISHSHFDHWGGNQAIDPQVPIITAHAIREDMPAATGWLEELRQDPTELEQEIQETRELLEAETDPRRRAALETAIARMSHLLEMLPTLALRLPTLTFGEKLIFYGTQRLAELRTVSPGHTVCDTYLVLPEERIMFAGDLGFFQSQPFLVFADSQAWTAWMEEAEQSDVEVFVPGHGPLGTKTDLALQRRYIAELEELVARAIQDGLSIEETMEQPLPAPFDAWVRIGKARWEANVHATYERLSGRAVT